MHPFAFAVAVTLLPTLVFAAPPRPTNKRVSAVLVPMDQGAEGSTVKLESYMYEALEAYPTFTLKKADDAFGLPKDEAAEASFKRAETGFTESKAAYVARDYEDAERKLRATIKEYAKAAAAMKDCGNLCETVAMYGAVLHRRGDVDEARLAVQDLLALAPTYELPLKKFDKDFISFRAQIATSSTAALRGNVNVTTTPPGARVYLDGELQGYTPTTLQTLPIGKHHVRIERPGFQLWGQLVEVSPEDTELNAELTATPQYKAFDGQLDKVATEVNRGKGGSALSAMGKALGVDRAVVGTLKEINESGSMELSVGWYDLNGGKKLASKKVIFQGDEFGQLKSEVARVVTQLVNSADGEQVVRSADPLENKGGMEDWNAEDRGGKSTSEQKKKKARDPLDAVQGTEDW